MVDADHVHEILEHHQPHTPRARSGRVCAPGHLTITIGVMVVTAECQRLQEYPYPLRIHNIHKERPLSNLVEESRNPICVNLNQSALPKRWSKEGKERRKEGRKESQIEMPLRWCRSISAVQSPQNVSLSNCRSSTQESITSNGLSGTSVIPEPDILATTVDTMAVENDHVDSETLSDRRRRRRPRVPLISMTALYNRLQTTGVVLIDCRSKEEFQVSHIRGSLHCAPPLRHINRRTSKRTVDDVLLEQQLTQHEPPIVRKLATRDMMEIVIIGANKSSAPILFKREWGYKFARMLIQEARAFSVQFLAHGFPAFAKKYPFMLRSPSTKTPDSNYTGRPDDDQLHYPNEILKNFLYLGNFWQANSLDVITALQITHIVNMGAITDKRNKFHGVEYLDVTIQDNENVDIRKEFTPTVEFIQRAAQSNGRVLIHCVQGVSRSSTIVIWYIMLTTKCTLSAAYSHVLKCRPLIFPNRGFMEQLMATEKQLYGFESVNLDEIDLLQSGLLAPLDRRGSELRPSFT